MLAEIISIGDELLIGQVINTNASWLAEKLNEAGIKVNRIMAIADDEDSIKNALDESADRVSLVLITGGLGPTKDDITKKTLAWYFGADLKFNEEVFQHIQNLFGRMKRSLNDLNYQQAYLPQGCRLVKNEHGTAAGMWFEKNSVQFISMPGVPYEMKAMMETSIIPELRNSFVKGAIVHKTVLTHGMGESSLAKKIEHWENELPKEIKLAYLPKPGVVRLRLSAHGSDRKILLQLVEKEIKSLYQYIPENIFGFDKDTLEEITGNKLRQLKLTLATAESCTGGYIAHLLTSVPGSSDYNTGGVVAYANEIKENVLGVEKETLINYGAVSQKVVMQMAAGAKKVFNTDYSIATTGVAGPTGGTEEKPVGLVWVAIATPNGITTQKFYFGKNRERNIQRTSFAALNMLRLELLKQNNRYVSSLK